MQSLGRLVRYMLHNYQAVSYTPLDVYKRQGLIGVILGVAAGSAGAVMMNYPVRPSIPAALGAVAFSMAIGVFFGYYPARRAAMLDPIEALRYE